MPLLGAGPNNTGYYQPVDATKILNGKKNHWANEVKFEINMNNNNQARIRLYDATTEDNVLKKRSVDE